MNFREIKKFHTLEVLPVGGRVPSTYFTPTIIDEVSLQYFFLI